MELHDTRSTNAAAGGPAAIATPDSLELTTVEELVRRHAPDLLSHTDRGFRLVVQGLLGVLMASVAVPVLAAIGIRSMGSALGLASAAGIAVAFGVGQMMRERQRRFEQQLKNSPWMAYDVVASQFAAQVEHQRARTIGPESEWGLARLRLDTAANDADRSVAYWTQRLAVEPNSEIAKAQIATATRLRDKFRTALTDLDQRARMLVSFFNDCEARVAVMQSRRRDYEEIRKLEALADKSDDVVAHAEGTLASIGASFVAEALRVGNALGGLERIGLVHLAGEVGVDHLEALADRIVESSERDRSAIERVVGSI